MPRFFVTSGAPLPLTVEAVWKRVQLRNHYLPGDLERQIGTFVDEDTNQRHHEGLNNVAPADVYFGRNKAIPRERERIKKQTIPLSGSCFAYPSQAVNNAVRNIKNKPQT